MIKNHKIRIPHCPPDSRFPTAEEASNILHVVCGNNSMKKTAINCVNCGAPLDRKIKCEYCGTMY